MFWLWPHQWSMYTEALEFRIFQARVTQNRTLPTHRSNQAQKGSLFKMGPRALVIVQSHCHKWAKSHGEMRNGFNLIVPCFLAYMYSVVCHSKHWEAFRVELWCDLAVKWSWCYEECYNCAVLCGASQAQKFTSISRQYSRVDWSLFVIL